MTKSRSVLFPVSAALVAVALLGRAAFLGLNGTRPQQARAHTRLRSAAESIPTGLVWPSEEAEAKLREVDGIKLYPTHAWTDDMVPVVPAKAELDNSPVIIGVAADSGCGKSTFLRRILGALGTEVTPGHTAIGDMMTVICLDDYHTNDRAGRKATGLTALDAKENDFALMGAQIEALKQGKAVYKPIYNHDTGNKDPPELIEPNKVMVFEGLHPIYDEKARSQLDLGIYIDIVNDVKFAWKVQRDVAERGWTEEQVRADIEKRLPDFSAYVDPQKANADVILRYEPSDQGLPYLKVKLIQKKGSQFPPITLKEDLTLPGSPGATLKMYDDDWFGSPATVIEMDGEIDMDNMEAQLNEVEENIEGLVAKNGEFTEAMTKLKSSPGSQNGTGLLQTLIAMKVREVYENLTAKKTSHETGKKTHQAETGKESPGATLKMYDDDWFGSPATVIEMDGEIDMDNMEAQLQEIEENIEGLVAKNGELTEAMTKLKSSPGSQNGTGLLQTVIAMKVREVYENLTTKKEVDKTSKKTPSTETGAGTLKDLLLR
eukprot:CAMPEP_0172929086 /NCGR_PEP_ID=MMETSP1075-20121228/218304_1 /TAXON_ID=2916 /ORGANISM="Ceratium fusus, Strain PA161109" /LENGTH=545 /DNA_ID=CAMNT_0013790375 /DNA_START=33 /DNA_END=1670 /DNA_ORIENTATION=+